MSADRVVVYAVGRAGIGHAMRARRLAEHLVRGTRRRVEVVVVTGHVGAGVLLGEGGPIAVRVPDATVQLLEHRTRTSLSLDVVHDARQALVDVIEEVGPTVVVSTSPSGLHGEFRDAMERARGEYRTVLALRDIYHPPRYLGTYDALGERFDEILVAGPRELSRWTPPQIRNRDHPPVTYGGYLSPLDVVAVPKGGAHVPLLRCQVGGGRDGDQTVAAVVEAFAEVRSAFAVDLHVDVGPFFAPESLRRLRSVAVDGLEVSTWSPSDRRIAPPTAVISMAGYNSSVEAAWTGVPTLLWPRHDDHDLEQRIRAAYFAERFGSIQVHDGTLRSLRRWIEQQIGAGEPKPGQVVPPGFFAVPRSVAERVLDGGAATSEDVGIRSADASAAGDCAEGLAR